MYRLPLIAAGPVSTLAWTCLPIAESEKDAKLAQARSWANLSLLSLYSHRNSGIHMGQLASCTVQLYLGTRVQLYCVSKCMYTHLHRY